MARVFGLAFVALQVRDLESSARFYEQRLGWSHAPQVSPNAVLFQTGTVPFAVRRPLVDLFSTVAQLGWVVTL